jgi:hypothetical protein
MPAMPHTKFCYTITLCLGAALFGSQARAESECEQNYRTAPSTNGATIHGTSMGLHGTDIKAAATRLKQKGLGEGWDLVTETNAQDAGGARHVIIFGQKPTEKSRGIFPIVQLIQKTDSAIIAVELPDQMSAPTLKSYFCSFLASAGLNEQTADASATNADQNFAYATELIALHSGNDKPMEQRFQQEYRAALDQNGKDRQAAQAAAAQAAAAEAANDRGAPPPVADRRKVVKPKSAFKLDEVDPTQLLEGHSTLSGLTCARADIGGKNIGYQAVPAANQTILLFPYTAYVKESIDLLNQYRHRLDSVRLDIDQRAFLTRIEGRTNAEGKFQFARLKPGRYLLMTTVDVTLTHIETNPAGSVYDGASNTITNFWKTEEINQRTTDLLQADVTIKNDGDIVNGVVVKPMGRLIPVLGAVCKFHLN